MPRYVKSHTVQLVNPKIERLRNEYGLAAFGAFHNVMLAAKDQNPAGRFLNRDYLEGALWPESVEHIDALIECGLLVIKNDGVAHVSGWNKWQSADAKLIAQEERSARQQEAMRAKWRRQYHGKMARRKAAETPPPDTETPRAESAETPPPMAEWHSTETPPDSAPNTPNRSSAERAIAPQPSVPFGSVGASLPDVKPGVASGEVKAAPAFAGWTATEPMECDDCTSPIEPGQRYGKYGTGSLYHMHCPPRRYEPEPDDLPF